MRWGSLAGALALAGPAAAQDLIELRRCVELPPEKARLDCFDRQMNATIAPPAKASRWLISETIDEVDGGRRMVAIVKAAGVHAERAAVIVRCIQDSVDAMIEWPTYLGLSDVLVQWRADGGKPQTDIWSLVGSGYGVHIDNPREFLARLAGRRTLVVHVAPSNDSRGESITFPIEGVDKATRPLLQTCKY